jgi:hypothetical protein
MTECVTLQCIYNQMPWDSVFIGGYLVVSVVGICYIIYKLFKDGE